MSTHPTLLVLASRVAKSAQIKSVELLQTSARREVEVRSPLTVEYGAEASAEWDKESGSLRVSVTLQMCGRSTYGHSKTSQDMGCDPAIEIDGTFLVVYGLPDSGAFSSDEIDAFGRVNGTYNVWPYWREYVQSVTTRMGLPPLALPLLTVEALRRMFDASDGEKAGPEQISASD